MKTAESATTMCSQLQSFLHIVSDQKTNNNMQANGNELQLTDITVNCFGVN